MRDDARWDVVVVGAGPAGAMAARACAERGARVLLVDRASFPRWKVCGACLGPGGRHALERARLGSLVDRLGATPLAHLLLTHGRRVARVRLNGNMAVSRAALDLALTDAAATAGVTVRTGVRAELVPGGTRVRLRQADSTSTELVRADVVVDATGLAGGLDADRPEVDGAARVGVGAVYDEAPLEVLPGDLHMVVAPSGYVGMVRDEEGRLNVAAAVDRGALGGGGIASALETILGPAGLASVLEAEPVHGWRGTPPLTRTRRRLAGGGVFRVGDAAGYVEPFTGEGIGWALAAGLDVAPFVLRALEGWADPIGDEWHEQQSRRMRRAQRFCRLLAGGLRRPRLVRTSIRMMERYPRLARPFVSAGSVPVRP